MLCLAQPERQVVFYLHVLGPSLSTIELRPLRLIKALFLEAEGRLLASHRPRCLLKCIALPEVW